MILLSHLHVDHSADLPALVKGTFFTERNVDLPIYGPTGNARFPNGDNHTLETLAAGVDLLVAHNAVPEGAQGVERNLHMPPSVIGAIAAKAKVKRLVLSHRMNRTLGREKETEKAIREQYKGPMTFADDGQCFPVLSYKGP